MKNHCQKDCLVQHLRASLRNSFVVWNVCFWFFFFIRWLIIDHYFYNYIFFLFLQTILPNKQMVIDSGMRMVVWYILSLNVSLTIDFCFLFWQINKCSIFYSIIYYNYQLAQLNELRHVTLAGIICANGDRIRRMQPFAMLAPTQHG